MSFQNVLITGTGSYVPTGIKTNEDFSENVFYNDEGEAFESSHAEISEKFLAITGIRERRYVSDDLVASDIGSKAAAKAIEEPKLNTANKNIKRIFISSCGHIKGKNPGRVDDE